MCLRRESDIEAVEIDATKEEVAEIFRKTGFSRLPVYEGDLDKILGVLNQKDFHNYVFRSKKTISDFVKPVVYVAGSMKAADLLKKLQINKSHIAIIVDEYGGTAGLVTMEDIIEELVGDIYDEHDEVEAQDITLLQDGSYRVLCSTNVEKMFDYFDEEVELDATTVNGWVVLQLDKLPSAGDTFTYRVGNKLFNGRVIKADARKAIEINLRVEEIPEENDNGKGELITPMGLMEKIFGDLNEKEVKKLGKIADQIEALDDQMQKLSDEELQAKTPEFKERLKNGETLDDILPEAFAVCREGASRSLGMKHFRVQLIGGIVLHQGRIAEMKTGEGKTLVATLAVYLNALEGKGVHVVTVNDYLAKRDAEWMGKLYSFLGLTVGCVVHGITNEERRRPIMRISPTEPTTSSASTICVTTWSSIRKS